MRPEDRDPAYLLDIVLAARQAIELAKASGMRNILVHECGRADVAEVWRTVHEDPPGLIAALAALLPPEPADA